MKYSIFYIYFIFIIEGINAALKPRIVGGNNAVIREFPFQASIRVDGTHVCGGCIISNKHILTAAHCVTRVEEFVAPYLALSVKTGSSYSSETELDMGYSYRIARATVHPDWIGTEETSLIHDIAVITLVEKITFNQLQQKIDLVNHDVVRQEAATFSGWGHIAAKDGTNADQLQKLEMRLLSGRDCQLYHTIQIHDEQLCAYSSPGHGACYGDSGSPLVVDNKLVGILSWVADDCAKGTAEIFTNVFRQRDFIRSAMHSNEDSRL